MASSVRNRLLVLGVLWGLSLAVVPALVMTSPYRLTGFLVAALICAALSGCVGTLAAGRRAARSGRTEGTWRSEVLAGLRTGASQGLVGGGVAALLFWLLIAVTASGFTSLDPVELSALTSPRVFMGSFYVALSALLYAFVGGLLLGPIFGTLVNRAVRAGEDAGGDAGGGDAGGKENLVVR
ncbi:MAG: hypothetical protein M3N18_06865 [Actinomycetota bacterium]|nr:hypothetical protein [Actinomycetota bacterium]